MISRRQALACLAGWAVLHPAPVRSQPTERKRLVAMLATALSDEQWQAHLATFAQSMQQLGWQEGRNLRIAARLLHGGSGPEEFRDAAREAVGANPDVIVARATVTALPILEESRSIPVVAVGIGLPVELGMATSLAHPGGNFTGFTNLPESVTGKYVQLLREIAPTVSRVLAPLNPANLTSPTWRSAIIAATAGTGVTVSAPDITREDEVEPLLAAFAAQPGGGLVVPPQVNGLLRRAGIVGLAARYRLPAVYITRDHAEAGGLMSYNIDTVDEYRKAAGYVDRILRGEKPGDLPIQNPSRFELVINRRTATSLGLVIAPSLLARADEVIE